MTIVFAPDGFKGSIGARAAAAALAAGWSTIRPDDRAVLRPMADGGEGTLEAFAVAEPHAVRMPVEVHGPHGRAVDAEWLLVPPTPGFSGGTGVVELAGTSGIELLHGELRPFDADTTGFGQAIAAALDHGVSRLVLGIGSSASTDGGAGLLTALGARITDAGGHPIPPGAHGLASAARVDLSGLRPLPPRGVVVLTDVSNPLTGDRGAAAVFGPQKGLAGADIPAVDSALARFAALVGGEPSAPGAGAAGGAGFALEAWGAGLVSGAVAVAELLGLRETLAEASVVVTGEGSYDAQSAAGKAPAHIADLAASAGIPALLAAGRIAPDADLSPFGEALSLTELAGSADAALSSPARWLEVTGAQLARRF